MTDKPEALADTIARYANAIDDCRHYLQSEAYQRQMCSELADVICQNEAVILAALRRPASPSGGDFAAGQEAMREAAARLTLNAGGAYGSVNLAEAIMGIPIVHAPERSAGADQATAQAAIATGLRAAGQTKPMTFEWGPTGDCAWSGLVVGYAQNMSNHSAWTVKRPWVARPFTSDKTTEATWHATEALARAAVKSAVRAAVEGGGK